MKTKCCTKCQADKPLGDFGIEQKGKYGRRSVCRSCRSKHEKQDPEYRRKHYIENRDYIRQQQKTYYQDNADQIKQARLNYYYANKEAHNEYMKGYLKKRREEDPKFRLHKNVAGALWFSLREQKPGNWECYLGYTIDELMDHLERQFTADMTWDNYGEWHLDHIKPVAAFDFTSPDDDQFKECWALNNLQPLWATDNLQKGASFNES